MMNWEKETLSGPINPEQVFQLHPKIRWSSFSTQDGRVVFSEMRPGLTSYTSDREDRAFMEFGPQLMTGIAEKLSADGGAGKILSLIVNLEKDSVFLTQVRGGYVAISVDRAVAYDVFKELGDRIRNL
jgi:hypothetical protein